MDIKKEFRDFSVKHLGNNGLVTDQYMGMYGHILRRTSWKKED
jgi:ATP-dependent Clp protease protease subunit